MFTHMKRIALIFAFSSLLARAGDYTQDMFRNALKNTSTAPDYVLITVRGPDDKAARTVCTTANLFLGAIHREYALDYSEASEKRAMEIALQQTNRSFKFQKEEAIKNLVDHGTPEALADVRRQFAGKKDTELLDQSFIRSITNKRPDAVHLAYRDAVAHALLERGIGCRMGDITDELYPQL